MPDPNDKQSLAVPLAGVLLVIAVGGAVDLVFDAPTDWLSPHVLYELSLIVGALGAATWLWRRWRRAERDNVRLAGLIVERQAERDAWRSSAEQALAGFARAIDGQLSAWNLTPAEREVVILLLKGRSHKEIANSSHRSERTVRQHAAAAYEKAGLAGRAELAAFFLTDLPLQAGTVPGERPGG